ncbi:LysR substrate-binding domain-containing protein [Agrococcus sp. BE272]|uniref:LysR family transcriptional regulator n=1 Tax=Agrococcus sp. BE272 TaxID=2817727 RepID=UPI00285468BD|nr:LysR substrate-binding domain-containing protein [Agrococcus sp. BE272]MDR7233612.1 DNA-binding transcriptional LysR family regulator [Agrococcus sp. BE272]
MHLSQLRCFLAAAELGTFTAAAEELGLTQPSVSESVRRLELDAGVELFARGPRRLALTGAGEQLLPWARRAVEGADGAGDVLDRVRGLRGGVGSFGVLRNASYYLLSTLAERFHRAHPGVRIRLVGQNTAEVVAAVRAGTLEAGLVVLPIDDEGLEVEPLARDEVLWVSADPARARRAMTMQRVPERPLILYDAHYGDRDPTRRQLADRAQAHGLHLEPVIEVENVETALDLVARGIGETLAARAVLRRRDDPELHAVAFAEPMHDVIALVRRRGSVLSPASAELSRMAAAMLTDGGLSAAPA